MEDVTYWVEDKTILCRDISLGTEIIPEYPSEWFSKVGQKPSLVVPNSESTLAALRAGLIDAVKRNSYPLPLAKEYLYKLFISKPSRCEVEWCSFGQKIALADTDVSLDNMAKVEYSDNKMQRVSGVEGLESEDKWLAALLLAPYRICASTHHTYTEKLIKMYDDRLSAYGAPKGIATGALRVEATSWPVDRNYAKLIRLATLKVDGHARAIISVLVIFL